MGIYTDEERREMEQRDLERRMQEMQERTAGLSDADSATD